MHKHSAQIAFKVAGTSGRGFDTTTSTKFVSTTDQRGKSIAVSNADLGDNWALLTLIEYRLVGVGEQKYR